MEKIKTYFRDEKVYLITVIALAAISRFLFISRRSIWHDEGFTMTMIQFDPLEIIARTARDVHPPFYYLLLHYWAQIFGNSELAIRGMSALLGIGVVIFTYLIIKKLFNQEAAKIAVLFTALGPFLIRYSQEARMWNLVAFLVTAATYFLIRAMESEPRPGFLKTFRKRAGMVSERSEEERAEDKASPDAGGMSGSEKSLVEAKSLSRWWILYSISLSLAAYTQYFSLLVLPVHWLYVLLKSLSPRAIQKPTEMRRAGSGIIKKFLDRGGAFQWASGWLEKPFFSLGWWLSNIFILGTFSFWLPILLAQTSRVSTGYWIQREWMTIRTVPSNLYRFLSYINFDYFRLPNKTFYVPNYIHELILIFIAAAAVYVFIKYKEKWREIIFILGYFLIPMYFIFFYSRFLTPIYQDRYFVWSAIAFYSFLALVASPPKPWRRRVLISIFIILLVFGIVRVYTTEAHGMREVGREVTKNYQTGDEIVAGELYAWFDFSYYNKTGHPAKIFSDPDWIKQGYGEASLIYEKADLIAQRDLNELKPASGRVWFIGRDPWRDYYKKIPAEWRELKRFQKDDSQVILYQVK